MLTFEKVARQGDLFIHRVAALPEGLVPAVTDNGAFVLAHSETGHNHVLMERPGVEVLEDPNEPLRAFLVIRQEAIDAGDIKIEHKRTFDTHETISPVTPGIYQITRQREYTPEGYRRAQD